MFPSSGSSQRAASNLSSLGVPQKNMGRNKVFLAPGHSPLDWAALTTKTPAHVLRGVQISTPPAQFVQIPLSELQKHKSRDNCWTCIQGKVYNITPYVDFHPGGEQEIMKCAGRDGTMLFNKYHSWINPERLLNRCMIGSLLK